DIAAYRVLPPVMSAVVFGVIYIIGFVLGGESRIVVRKLLKGTSDSTVTLSAEGSETEIPTDSIRSLAAVKMVVSMLDLG
ncbi:MAG: hypothetical protein IJS19_04585, partial [Muribaculaceae bacterium]|nr:hypothetical protein [Muribaculaceae bacterium]